MTVLVQLILTFSCIWWGGDSELPWLLNDDDHSVIPAYRKKRRSIIIIIFFFYPGP